LGLAAFQALRGHLSLGDVLIVFMGYQSGLGFMGSALQGLSGLYEDSLFLSNFYDFLALQPAIQAPPHPRALPSPFRRALVFEDVTFCYPQGIAPALQGVNLTLEPGQVIALVGENGSGKTTLVKLLCRLYDPTAGRITLDGIDLRDLDPLRWRAEISVIFQDFIHYHLPAWENIWFGDVGRPPDRDAIRRAALASGIHPAISRLPRDYDTALGTWFEDGHELSTGEWQKLALARMFLRHANLIVLDEPTSALDPLAEADLFYRFRRLVGSRAAILISHRFSTVQMADLIYVLKGGQLVESGSHAELLHRDGYYAAMYRAQAGLYASEPAYAL
jgi:ATP-binding cassette subfamily B protein